MTDAKLEYNEDEEEFNMCKGMDDFRNKYEEKGKQAGIIEEQQSNIKTMNKNGADAETISKLLSLDINYVKEVLDNK